MDASRPTPQASLPQRIRSHFAHGQHRTAYFLTINNLMGAATGFVFWILLARLGGLSPAVLGVGYTVVALGTLVGVIAKGGLDTALLQKSPGATRAGGHTLLVFGFLVGAGIAVTLTALMAIGSHVRGFLPDLTIAGWVLVASIAVLLLLCWLQDAYFVALGHARFSFERNLALSVGRLLLPLPVIALALAHPVPLTWMLALGVSAVAGLWRLRHIPEREGRHVPRREFLRSAARNVSGGAAEFLPGLLLAPLVLALDGPAAAAYFGMAWTAASLLFQVSGAIGRSALAEMIRAGPAGRASAIRKGAIEHLWLVAPLAILTAAFAPVFLGLFGHAFAKEGAPVLVILCASAVFVAPTSLYLAVLRSRERSFALVAFPAAMVVSLLVWAPVLGSRFGLTGVAMAWLLSNAPFGVYAAWHLRRATREVMPYATAPSVVGRADLE